MFENMKTLTRPSLGVRQQQQLFASPKIVCIMKSFLLLNLIPILLLNLPSDVYANTRRFCNEPSSSSSSSSATTLAAQQQNSSSIPKQCTLGVNVSAEATKLSGSEAAAAAVALNHVGSETILDKNEKQKQNKNKNKNKRGKRGERVSSSLSSSMLRSFIRTNNMRAYHLDLHNYRDEIKFSGDANYVNSLDRGHQSRCAKHLNYYYELLKLVKQSNPMDETVPLEALKLADLFGRPPAGLLEGNQFWLGSYESCREHEIHLEEEEEQLTIKSQYCLGLTQFPSWNKLDTKTSIKVGLCLPETCTNFMLNNINNANANANNSSMQLIDLVEIMMKFQFGGYGQPFERLKLRSIYCLPHESSEIRQFSTSAKLLIIILASFVLLTIYSTFYDYLNVNLEKTNNQLVLIKCDEEQQQVEKLTKRAIRMKIIESFSLFRNIDKFLTIKNNNDENNEQNSGNESNNIVQNINNENQDVHLKFNREIFSNSITGLKCLGLIWIIAAHTFLVSPIESNNLITIDKLTSTIVANIYLSAHLMVDTFFALSGLLAAYLLFKSEQLSQIKLLQWISLTVHRYWRLTPIYILCYWFTKSLGHLLNSGPLWDFGTAKESPRFNCEQESWWNAILHLSDFKSPKDHCVPFAWFIANGIKFWLLTPFILIAIYKSIKRGYQIAALLILANMILVAKLAFNSNVDMKSVIEFKPESAENMLNNMDQIYTRPYSRIGAYLVGLLAGHCFYLIDTKQLQFNLSKNAKILLWTLFSVTTIVMTFVLKLANGLPLDDSAIPYIFSLCSALIRPLWALCSCWLVFGLSHGQASWFARFLSAPIWKILVKLSFCAYLAQGEVIAHLYLAQTQSTSFTYLHLITRPIVATVLTMAASLIMLLFIEYPLIGIEQLILPARKRSKSTSEKLIISENLQLQKSTLTNTHLSSSETKQTNEKLKHL